MTKLEKELVELIEAIFKTERESEDDIECYSRMRNHKAQLISLLARHRKESK